VDNVDIHLRLQRLRNRPLLVAPERLPRVEVAPVVEVDAVAPASVR
jgi:hypothetical protein